MSDGREREAFEGVYRSHASSIFTHFLQRGVSHADAQDLTAEVFAIAWRRRSDIEPHPTAGFLPWLMGVANNLLKGQRRSVWRAHRALSRLPREDSAPDIAEDLTDKDEDQFRLRLLILVLSALTVPEQEVIQYCVMRGLSPMVVSDLTGEDAGTIRSRLSRALAKARARYTEISADQPPNAAPTRIEGRSK